jgi:4-deoxy-L-threo-5-hexosulose-uronate ketol-isomerase
MKLLPAIDPQVYARRSTAELREAFLVDGLFQSGLLVLNHWETDRTVIGSAVPGATPLELGCPRELAAQFFNERRELGIINLGGPGSVATDGQTHALGPYDCLYVGRGVRRVTFASESAARPSQFYLLSYPAHTDYPTTLASYAATPGTDLGSPATANARRLHKFIHPDGIKSCQLVMGMTFLAPGSVWNTMPPHTHLRRSEVYLYFDIAAEAALVHLAGRPDETRHLMVRDRQAVLSPPWSIHSGVGTGNYTFIWGMGGENQAFADMDAVSPSDLR